MPRERPTYLEKQCLYTCACWCNLQPHTHTTLAT
uniref:Uncharacterized protein n=1 Tax=Arundo donax TaxID=35708 RepID=A0A0A8Y1W0_ARUDO